MPNIGLLSSGPAKEALMMLLLLIRTDAGKKCGPMLASSHPATDKKCWFPTGAFLRLDLSTSKLLTSHKQANITSSITSKALRYSTTSRRGKIKREKSIQLHKSTLMYRARMTAYNKGFFYLLRLAAFCKLGKRANFPNKNATYLRQCWERCFQEDNE